MCGEIKKLSEDSSEFIRQFENSQKELLGDWQEYDDKLEHLRKSYQDNNREISMLVTSLTKAAGTPTEEYILRQIDELHNKGIQLKTHINELEIFSKTCYPLSKTPSTI